MSMNRCMDKPNAVFMYETVAFSFKKGNLSYAMTGINFEDIMLSEMGQSQKDKRLYDLTYTRYISLLGLP